MEIRVFNFILAFVLCRFNKNDENVKVLIPIVEITSQSNILLVTSYLTLIIFVLEMLFCYLLCDPILTLIIFVLEMLFLIYFVILATFYKQENLTLKEFSNPVLSQNSHFIEQRWKAVE